jgi:hypothetical protein
MDTAKPEVIAVTSPSMGVSKLTVTGTLKLLTGRAPELTVVLVLTLVMFVGAVQEAALSTTMVKKLVYGSVPTVPVNAPSAEDPLDTVSRYASFQAKLRVSPALMETPEVAKVPLLSTSIFIVGILPDKVEDNVTGVAARGQGLESAVPNSVPRELPPSTPDVPEGAAFGPVTGVKITPGKEAVSVVVAT